MAFIDLSSPTSPISQAAPSTTPVTTNQDYFPVQNNVSVSAAATQPAMPPNLTINEDHDLMRDIPTDGNNQTIKVNDQGIKEMIGAPVSQVNSVAQPIASSQPIQPNANNQAAAMSPSLETKPATMPAGNTNPTVTTAPLVPKPIVAPQAATTPVVKKDPPPAPVIPSLTQDHLVSPVSTAQADISLTGTAVGKEQEVKAILQNADNLIKEKIEIQKKVSGNKIQGIVKDGEIIELTQTKLVDLLTLAENKGASDLHLSVGYPPMIRVNDSLITLGGIGLTDQRIEELLTEVMTEREQRSLKEYLDVDFSYTHQTGTRFRVNIFHKRGSLAGAFRVIPSRIRSIAELGLPHILYDLLDIPQGLVILAGPTGSGKSSTIAALIQEINLNQPKHIVTIEDPIEYLFPKGSALVNQREIGVDVASFKRGLREVLREDPDVILVGEMRDFETIAMTITAAETGHLVFTTLHTNSASQTIDRIIDVFPDAQQSQIRAQLSNVITAVVSQRLVPVKSGGRRAVVEIMLATPAIKNAIREAKTYQIDNMIQTNSDLGMITLEKSLIELIRTNEITLEQAQSYTAKPDELISLMKSN